MVDYEAEASRVVEIGKFMLVTATLGSVAIEACGAILYFVACVLFDCLVMTCSVRPRLIRFYFLFDPV